jgi:hypothetical protein
MLKGLELDLLVTMRKYGGNEKVSSARGTRARSLIDNIYGEAYGIVGDHAQISSVSG